MFTGASQFAFVGAVAGGGNPLTASAAAVLVGGRNGLYGLRLAPVLRARGSWRAFAANLTIDESTAMALGARDGGEAPLAFWATGAAVFVLWNLATLLGALGVRAISDPAAFGLDAAAPAAFVAVGGPAAALGGGLGARAGGRGRRPLRRALHLGRGPYPDRSGDRRPGRRVAGRGPGTGGTAW